MKSSEERVKNNEKGVTNKKVVSVTCSRLEQSVNIFCGKIHQLFIILSSTKDTYRNLTKYIFIRSSR